MEYGKYTSSWYANSLSREQANMCVFATHHENTGILHILLDMTGRLIGKQWWLELLNFPLLTSIWDQAGSVRFLPLHSAWEGKQFLIDAICEEKIEVSVDFQPQLGLFSNA